MKAKRALPASIDPVVAFGVHDSNLRLMERVLGVKMFPVEDGLVIQGKEEAVTRASGVLDHIITLSGNGQPVSHSDIKILMDKGGKPRAHAESLKLDGIQVSKRGKKIKPRTLNQAEYVKNMLHHDLVFVAGPAGTGKTFLAVALALHLLHTGRVKKVVLTRPVVEAGESLGFLPGTLEEKIDPYLKPLFDAINDMLSPEEMRSYMDNQVIELAPLAYMRGRTLSNAFVILDEGQNTTGTQMKMFLTRLGENSKMVVTGDITQVDLPKGKLSGLRQAMEIFKGIEGIKIMTFEKQDVVRHGLVQKIIETYEKRVNETWKETTTR
jgi:phosphate starvation-inducible protein PhoH and related proteins